MGFYVRPFICYSVYFQFCNYLVGEERAGSRCLVPISVLWLSLMVLCVGLQCVIVVHAFPDDTHLLLLGAQWFSGRALDLRPRGRGFEPHRRHCVVVREQDTFILA